jgi:hypothetical protein
MDITITDYVLLDVLSVDTGEMLLEVQVDDGDVLWFDGAEEIDD